MWDDLATDGQVSYIYRLVEGRAVTRRTAERIIQLLEDCPVLGDNGLDFTHIKTELRDEQRKEE